MSKLVVLPYKTESASAKIVSEMLGVKRMLVVGSKLKDSEETTIVNWGNSTTDLSGLPSVKVINKQEGIRKASNKRDFFRAIQDHNEVSESPISIPDWTEDSAVAKEWYESGHDVVCRHTLQGHSGEGIEVVKFREEVEAEHAVPEAPLYTKYVKKRDEYRVHVVAKEAIFVQRKGRERDDDGSADINYQIRNHANGFIFLTQDLNPHKTVISESIKAVNALGLDFGAVDVIWNERRKAATVIEVNTACGLQSPSNILRYKQALKALLANEEQLPWDSPCEREEVQLDLTDAVTAIEGMRIDSSNNIGVASGTDLGSLGITRAQATDRMTYSVREGIEAGALTESHVRWDAEIEARALSLERSSGSASPTVGLMRELRELYFNPRRSFNNRLRDNDRVWLRPRVFDVLYNFRRNHPNHSISRTINDVIEGSRSRHGLIVSQCNGGRGMALVHGRSGMSWALPQSVLTTASPYMGEDLRA